MIPLTLGHEILHLCDAPYFITSFVGHVQLSRPGEVSISHFRVVAANEKLAKGVFKGLFEIGEFHPLAPKTTLVIYKAQII